MPLIQCHVGEKVKTETEMTPEFLLSVMEISAADLARMGSIEPLSSRSPEVHITVQLHLLDPPSHLGGWQS